MKRALGFAARSVLGLLTAGLAAPVMAAVSCSVSATGPAFGVYNPLSSSPTYANGLVTASCNWLSGNGTTTITLVSSYSTGNSGSYTTRKLLAGTSALSYNLYYDAAYSSIRGDGTGGSSQGGGTITVSRTSPTGSTSSVIYGRIPAGQDVAPGSYTDTINVLISY